VKRDGAASRFDPLVIPDHALLVIEERVRAHIQAGIWLPTDCDVRELAVKVLLLGSAFSRKADA
jgi:hypothetical protein